MTKIDKIYHRLLLLIVLITVFMSVFGFTAIKYKLLYEESIKQSAENIVTGLELLVACQSVGNVSDIELKKSYVDIFILPKLNITEEDKRT